jgi:hypothetical protein
VVVDEQDSKSLYLTFLGRLHELCDRESPLSRRSV